MNILGPRIHIRPTRHEDLAFLQSLLNDGTVMHYIGYPEGMHLTPDSMERWWATAPQAQPSAHESATVVTPHHIIALLDGTPIGEFSFSIDAHQRALVDLKLTPAFWGQHYATEALTLALHELFATSSIVNALAEPAQEHIAARHLLLHCGFHAQPSENHPDRMECTRRDFSDREKALQREG